MEVMPTFDSQVHAYERNHPGRPWAGTLYGPAEVTGDQMVAAMDAVGVDGAVLVSPFSMYRYDASYTLEVYKAHPSRFKLVKPVDPTDPAVAKTIADWASTGGTVGIRVFLRDNVSTDPADPAINRVLALAAQHFPAGQSRVHGTSGPGRGAGEAKPQHAAGDRSSGPATAARAAGSRAAVRRPAEAAGFGASCQCRRENQRR